MRKTVIILSFLAVITSGLGRQSMKRSAVKNGVKLYEKQHTLDESQPLYHHSYFATEDIFVIKTDSTFLSSIRPGEELRLGKIYTDTFEYQYFDDNADDVVLYLKKDTTVFPFIANELYGKLGNWIRGDSYKIEWNIDSMSPAGDDTQRWVEYFALKAEKIKDGRASLFRKKHPKPLTYTYYDSEGYTDSALKGIYESVEYYLANSKNELITLLVDDPASNISYSIEDTTIQGQDYTFIGISNDFEHHTNVVQWICLSNRKIYEYNIDNEELVEFKN